MPLPTTRAIGPWIFRLQLVLSVYYYTSRTFRHSCACTDGKSIDGLALNSSYSGDNYFHAMEPSPRIINGFEVTRMRYPYVAILNQGRTLKCGGVLIAPDIVLTAAHCSESFHEVQIGRHNRSDEMEEYESLIVEKLITHPRYYRNRFLDSDPHDFAVAKLFGQSKTATPISINKNHQIPVSDQQMHVFGWGSTDPNDLAKQSDVLLGANVYYMTNEECKTFVGTFGNHEVNFQRYVINATLCAMNFEELSDSCKGDSGSGLIITGREPQDDILVGIVSAGFGCANPSLPALYARVSEVYGWIRDRVCELSLSPPEYFECQEIDEQPAISSSQDLLVERVGTSCNDELELRTNISLEILLDSRPEELGWILRSQNKQGIWVTEVERPILTYSKQRPMSSIQETVSVRNNVDYELVILDSYGDIYNSVALIAPEMMFKVLDQQGNLLLSVSKSTVDPTTRYHVSFIFPVGVPPSSAPTYSNPPSTTVTPTSPPTEIRPFLTVVINFGRNPENIGFQVEKMTRIVNVTEDDNDDMISYELVHAVYPGTFSSESAGTTTIQTITLQPTEERAETYRFIMTSNEGRGFLSGRYEVWFGNPSHGELLFSGDKFYLEDANIFSIETKLTSQPSSSPTTSEPSMTTEQPQRPNSFPTFPGSGEGNMGDSETDERSFDGRDSGTSLRVTCSLITFLVMILSAVF